MRKAETFRDVLPLNWSKLSAGDQAILREEMGAVFARLDEINRVDDEAARSALRQHGINFVSPNPGEVDRWHGIADGSIDEMIESGIIPGDVVEQIRTLLQEFRGQQ